MRRRRGLLIATAETSADRMTVDYQLDGLESDRLRPLWGTNAFGKEYSEKKKCKNCHDKISS
jgi:hypothetical protein